MPSVSRSAKRGAKVKKNEACGCEFGFAKNEWVGLAAYV